jgi:hypothetical protein
MIVPLTHACARKRVELCLCLRLCLSFDYSRRHNIFVIFVFQSASFYVEIEV